MPIQVRKKKKIALVLSGGGAKAAAFHIGVCLALREKGFSFSSKRGLGAGAPEEPDTKRISQYVGSSAGAFVSAFLAAGYPLEVLINAFQVGAGKSPFYSDDFHTKLRPIRYRDIYRLNGISLVKALPRLVVDRKLPAGGFEAKLKSLFRFSGLFTAKGIESYLRNYVLPNNNFADLGTELYIVATQLNHTRKVIFGNFESERKTATTHFANFAKISEAVASSMSLPPVFAPFGIRDQSGKTIFMFDGEIRDTLSTHVAVDHGADLVISSYSVQPYHYNKEVGSLHRYGIPAILNQALYQVIEQKITRHIRHQNEISEIYSAMDAYLKTTGLTEGQRQTALGIVRQRANFRPEVDYVYIHPRPKDHEMFWADHFSLSPEILEKIVGIGFRSAITALRSSLE